MDVLVTSIATLDEAQKSLLSKNGVIRASDIWLYSPMDLAKKLKLTVDEVQSIIAAICKETAPKVQLLSDCVDNGPNCFTTGDVLLDEALGGGIRTGLITEISGESSSGKTQITLQLALTCQLSLFDGGLNSGVAYFTTTSALPVRRLTELARSHPSLHSQDPKSLMDNVHSCSTTTIPALVAALRVALPQLCSQVDKAQGRLKPVRVLIIDSLGSLFHSPDKTTTATLVERSKILSEIGQLLHSFASSNEAAVIIINQVTDIFQPLNDYPATPNPSGTDNATIGLIYRDQAVWFNRTPLEHGYPPREATLGLIWANIVNTRIMISRTRRRMRPNDEQRTSKRRKGIDGDSVVPKTVLAFSGYFDGLDEDMEGDIGNAIRKLSVIFSSHCGPRTMEFVVVKEGIRVIDTNSNQPSPPPVQNAKQNLREELAPIIDAVPVPSSTFVSARLTQVTVAPDEEKTVTEGALLCEEQGEIMQEEGKKEALDGEDYFDLFKDEDWGDFEEQWDAPEPDNQGMIASDPVEAGNHNEVVETSDVEENLLLGGMIRLSQEVLTLSSEKG